MCGKCFSAHQTAILNQSASGDTEFQSEVSTMSPETLPELGIPGQKVGGISTTLSSQSSMASLYQYWVTAAPSTALFHTLFSF